MLFSPYATVTQLSAALPFAPGVLTRQTSLDLPSQINCLFTLVSYGLGVAVPVTTLPRIGTTKAAELVKAADPADHAALAALPWAQILAEALPLLTQLVELFLAAGA